MRVTFARETPAGTRRGDALARAHFARTRGRPSNSLSAVTAERKMFYSQYILAKRGPLGTIWIAAHLDRKLRKNQIAETDIVSSVST